MSNKITIDIYRVVYESGMAVSYPVTRDYAYFGECWNYRQQCGPWYKCPEYEKPTYINDKVLAQTPVGVAKFYETVAVATPKVSTVPKEVRF